MLKRGREPEGERGSTVVYFPQQQEKEKRKYQLMCEIAPTPFPGYPRSTAARYSFKFYLGCLSATLLLFLKKRKTKH